MYFFETGDDLVARRQVEVYACGRRLLYDESHPEDEHGFLELGRIFPDDEWPELFEITAREFERQWNPDGISDRGRRAVGGSSSTP